MTHTTSRTVLACWLLIAVPMTPMPAAAQAHTLYGLVDGANSLLRFSSATPAATETVAITGLAQNETMRGIDFRPLTGELVGIAVDSTGAQLRYYTIDVSSGVAKAFGAGASASVPGTQWGMSFNPVVDRIRLVNSSGANLRMNPNTGALAGLDPNLSGMPMPVVDAVAYDRPFAGTPQSTIFAINRTNSTLAYQGGLNGTGPGGQNGGAITAVGSLGITLNTTSPTALEITTNGVMFAALRPTAGSVGLYTINSATGAATLIGTIGNGAQDIASLAVVDPSLSFSPGPGTYTSTQRFDLVLQLSLLSRGVVAVVATFDGIDVTSALASCVRPGLTASGDLALRCASLGGPVFGTGTHILDITLTLSDGSRLRRAATWTIVPVVEP